MILGCNHISDKDTEWQLWVMRKLVALGVAYFLTNPTTEPIECLTMYPS